MQTKTPRKYRMVRVSAGDYILPSNDGQTFWRVRAYEDGPSHGIMDWPRDITLWSCYRWCGARPPQETREPLYESNWRFHADNFATRAEAIEAALSQGASHAD